VVLFLAMDPAAAASREGFGEERYEKLAFQQQVCRGFLLGTTQGDACESTRLPVLASAPFAS